MVGRPCRRRSIGWSPAPTGGWPSRRPTRCPASSPPSGERVVPTGVRWAAVGGSAGPSPRPGSLPTWSRKCPSQALAEAFPAAGRSSRGGADQSRVLFPRAEKVRGALGRGLRDKGWQVDEVVAYRTRRSAEARDSGSGGRPGRAHRLPRRPRWSGPLRCWDRTASPRGGNSRSDRSPRAARPVGPSWRLRPSQSAHHRRAGGRNGGGGGQAPPPVPRSGVRRQHQQEQQQEQQQQQLQTQTGKEPDGPTGGGQPTCRWAGRGVR